jgi:ribosomal protein S18 acetylase RimI-like enzyme
MTRVRRAEADEYRALMRVVEGALLDVDPETVRAALDDGRALVAVDDGRVVGGLVHEDGKIVAVAVAPGRRGEGLGRTLVDRADAATDGPLTATFDGRVRGFYESLGFEIEERDGAEETNGTDRFAGVRR